MDAGYQTSFVAGLHGRTTASDSATDSASVDLGYHYRVVVSLTVLRGTRADALSPHRTIESLPFSDGFGTLSDPVLPLLFYRVIETENELRVDKHLAADAVRLSLVITR